MSVQLPYMEPLTEKNISVEARTKSDNIMHALPTEWHKEKPSLLDKKRFQDASFEANFKLRFFLFPAQGKKDIFV